MITKQQALEFIYDLSQKYEVTINSYLGIISVKGFDSEDIEYETPVIDKGLEGAVQEFIREYPHIAKEVSNKIPVDVDMLEEGQTYKVEFLDYTGVLNSFTEKLLFLFITEEGETVFNFSNGYYTKYIDIKEIYKVNE